MLITNEQVGDWKDLQHGVHQLFEEMGYTTHTPYVVELSGRGKKEVDVYVEDERASTTHRIIIECKWWESSVPQEVVHSFYTVMQGCGANTGFIVSKVGFQRGAVEAIASTNINLVTFEELQHVYGEEWFQHQKSEVESRVASLRRIYRLHFDQEFSGAMHNNMFFHTPELGEELRYMHAWCGNLMLESNSVSPESYADDGPIEMANDPLAPLKDPPEGSFWHTTPSVREYYRILICALDQWIDKWQALHDKARGSFDQLPGDQQGELMSRALFRSVEELPVRVLRQHVGDEEYERLVGLLSPKRSRVSEMESKGDA